jgi:hypothetical protein
MYPGTGSFQSAKVRIGTLRRTAEEWALRRRRPPESPARSACPDRGQHPVDRGCTDLAESEPHRLVEHKMAMPLHCRDQQRDERLQPLPADPVARFPEHNKRLSHRFVINPASRPGPSPVHGMFTPQEAFSVLAVIPGDFHELRQNPTLSGSGRGTVSRRHRLQKFVSRTHADPPHVDPRTNLLREQF